MTNEDLKTLKKLADICRKSGISSFECEQFKFTLSLESRPVIKYAKEKQTKAEELDNIVQERPLTEEELLFFSVPSYGGPEGN